MVWIKNTIMKTVKTVKNIVIVLSLILLGLYLWGTFIKTCPPEGYVLMKQSDIDSMRALADKPPEVVIEIDTQWIKVTEYIDVPIKEPIPESDSINYYPDTLTTEYFSVVLKDRFKNNTLLSRSFTYRLYIPQTTKTITEYIKVPYPYYSAVDQGKIYGGVGLGNAFMADISYRWDDNYLGVGVGYLGYPNERFFYVRYQRKIW